MYKKTYPLTCVWEITMACNMRCKHCGSSCEHALPGELTTQEAFDFVDMCKDIGMKWVSISGGEPFTRPDLLKVIKRFEEKGILINIISNGWLIGEDIIDKLKDVRGLRVNISIDGPEYIHDDIRKPGSFARSKKSFEMLRKNGIAAGCITTVTKKNIDHLNELKYFLTNNGVECWQLQIGLPMGNLAKRPDWVISPEEINKIIDFCYDTATEGKIDVYPADCIGYYGRKQGEIYKKVYNIDFVPEWEGCNAGKNSFGILHNGDIVGCTSIRDKDYIEGNIKERSLRDIWEDDNSFKWIRNFDPGTLKGDCLNCGYTEKCKGGCPNTRYCMNGRMDSENLYCTQNLLMKSRQN